MTSHRRSGRSILSATLISAARISGALRRGSRACAALLALALVPACGGDGPSGSEPNPAPGIATLSPQTVGRGSGETTLTVRGGSFVRQSVVRLGGADRPTEYVSATELRAHLGAADFAAAGVAQVTVFNPAPGGGESRAKGLTVTNPVPQFTDLSVDTLVAGSPGTTVTITGANFFPETTVWGPHGNWQVTYVSSTELRVALTADDLKQAGSIVLYLSNPEPGGGSDSSSPIQIVNPAPAITALSPTFVPALTPATVTITGTGFYPLSRVYVGAEPRQSTFVSATQLRVDLTASDAGSGGTLAFRVENFAPGGGMSNTATLEVRAPVPVATSLLDATIAAGGNEFVVYVNGSGFVYNSQVRFNGQARPTQIQSLTQLRATLTAADLATPGTYPITVFNPGPGGGVSNAVSFVVANPVPGVTSLSPAFVPTGGAGATVTVRGLNFVPQSQGLAEGSPRTTTYVSAMELRVALTAADVAPAGDIRIGVRNPLPGGGVSNEAALELRAPVPVLTSLSPAQVMDGQSSLTLRVNGTGFASNSVVHFDLSPRPTRQVSATQLEATLGAADLRNAGGYPIHVETPGVEIRRSSPLELEVRAPAPVITSLDTTRTAAGQTSFFLRVHGTGFRIDSRVRLDGQERPGGYLGTTLMEAILDESDLRTARTFEVTVATPGPGGGVSNAVQFHVVVSPQGSVRVSSKGAER